eukprot:PRCOL_00004780-RA
MAGAAGKKRLAENARRLATLRAIVLGCLAAHVLTSYVVFRASTGWKDYVFTVVTGAAGLTCYSMIVAYGRPKYAVNGSIVDAGGDLSAGGMTQYYFDVVYLMAVAQVGGILSRWFWCVLWAIPAYAAYKAWTLVIKPYIFTPREGDDGYEAGGRAQGMSRKDARKEERQRRKDAKRRA